MLKTILKTLQVLVKGLGILKSIFMIIFVSFLIYITINTKSNLIKYDGIPCQNKIFTIKKPMEKVIGGDSTMRKGYYHISKNLLQDIHEDYVTVKKTGKIFPQGSKFKIISYYVSFDTGPLSGLGGGPVPNYLVQSLETGEYFWISYFEFDTNTCNISNDINDTNFDITEHKFDKNIIETTIKI